MSGIETLLASAFTGLTTAGTTGAATASLTAAEVAAIAGGTAEALAGGGIVSGFAAPAASAGLTTAAALSAGASLAGAGAQLLNKAPNINQPRPPTRDDARAEAERRSAMLKRRGRAATILTSPQGAVSTPTLGAASLTGTG
jgi:hypothetical protein